ncbi:uncharacterized protein LOC128682014 [Plodia interpunctella]|uniref:uncharacterized protein LOC128682014 n=1 Tax=Plodia interpunctella TaxID=58824 RepID=UPI002368EF8B|nr:uncharacterized protein LOC128682014 [Plodia interpunctella]
MTSHATYNIKNNPKMSQDDEKLCHLYYLPTELLLYIFTLLPAKDLTECRQVCSRWKLIVDGLARSDSLWRGYCKKDFKDIYQTARYKAKPGLLWYNIYRSLSLWPKLAIAREYSDEFASASHINDEIRNFRILRHGIIGVHKRGSIVYYDINTLEPSKRGTITGDFATYAENDYVIAIKSYHLNLYIVRKELLNRKIESSITYDNVKSFILIDLEIYYVTLDDDIYVCNLTEMTQKFVKRTEDGVMSLGFTDRLHILTFQRNIYTLVNNDLVFNCTLGPTSNLLHQLQQYRFLEQLDWRVYFQWMYALNHTVPQGPLRDIVTVRSYGDIFFVGSNWGVLRIYHAPYSSGEFDLFNSEPVKQYNFMERRDCPVLSMCPILQIDVCEIEDGHSVMVAMPKKVAVLNFKHSFKRTASVAMLPYDDVQKVKFLKIDDGN